MEWSGINLTNYHQINWSKNAILLIAKYLFLSLIAVTIAIIIHLYTNKINQIKNNYILENKQLSEKITNKNQRLNQFILKQKLKNETINGKNITKIFEELKQLPINGSLQEINIKHRYYDYFELFGKVPNQKAFDRLSAHLKKYQTSIDMFQTNANNELEFMLKVSIK